MNFGQYLKEARIDARLTLEDFSEQTGLSVTSLSLYENNKRIPSRYALDRIGPIIGKTYLELRTIIKQSQR